MSLDLSKLQNRKSGANGAQTAGCPVCMEEGRDHTRDHLVIYPDGKWGCLAFAGAEGKAHRKRIWALVGDGTSGEAGENQVESIIPQLELERTWPISILDRLIQDHSYWIKRGVKEDVLLPLRGGVATEGQMKGRYVFPIFNAHGAIIGFSGRRIDDKIDMKWKILGRSSNFVWGNRDAVVKKKEAILVESIGDGLALMSHDIQNVLVLFGVNLSQAILGVLISSGPIRIIIATNNDIKHDVGQMAANKIATILSRFFNEENILTRLPSKKDFGEMSSEEIFSWRSQIDI